MHLNLLCHTLCLKLSWIYLLSKKYYKIDFHDSELIRLTDPASIEEKIKDIEIFRLHDRLKQRQFLLEGFTCKLSTEKELAEWYLHLIKENKSDIVLWTKEFWKYSNDTPDEYPDGEFAPEEELDEDEKSKLISVGKYTKSCLAMYMVEFDILKKSS
nr:hypothetical protein [Treponema denticola]